MNEEKELIDLWKKNNIKEVVLTFDCGNDSMGNMEWNTYTEDGVCENSIVKNVIETYFDRVVYDNVDFYSISDGHYMGEYGTVSIVLDEEGDEPKFSYSKSAASEYEDSHTECTSIEITEEAKEVLQRLVSNLTGSQGEWIIVYKNDCIVTDEETKVINQVCEIINEHSETFDPDTEHEVIDDGFYEWTTNIGKGNLEFKDNTILFDHTCRVRYYQDEQ